MTAHSAASPAACSAYPAESKTKGYAAKLIDGVFKTKSLIPGKELGGNAGRSFHYRTVTRHGSCRIVVEAKGARWHKLTITVTKS